MSNSKKSLLNSKIVEVDRAFTELRKARPVAVSIKGDFYLVMSAEFFSKERIELLESLSKKEPFLLITSVRASKIGAGAVTTKDAKEENLLKVELKSKVKWHKIQANPLFNPLDDLEDKKVLFKNFDFILINKKLNPLTKLAKLAELLPAVFVAQLKIKSQKKFEKWAYDNSILTVSGKDIEEYGSNLPHDIAITTDAMVKLGNSGEARVVMIRPQNGGYEHMAIVYGNPESSSETPLVRVHSSCLTGDVLGSLRCDCGDQLKESIKAISDSGNGILVYVNQEGRGIGIVNKLRAYRLQDLGADTMEANEMIGFGSDEREFEIAVRILNLFNVKKIRLLTNNPNKVKDIESMGIKVAERVPLVISANGVNDFYLQTKVKKGGHTLREVKGK